MTFTEYINQEDPTRHPHVIITKQDCMSYIVNHQGETHITLEISGEFYFYVNFEGSDVFWTKDSDGNRKSTSCFYLK